MELLKRGGEDRSSGGVGRRARPAKDDGRAGMRCPRCGWRPGSDARWACECGAIWNTFETRGECPGCGRRWRETQCLRCLAWSPHDDWYVP